MRLFKAAELYQPEAVRPSVGGFQNTNCSCIRSKALEILEANQNQLKHQLLALFLPPAIAPFDCTYSI
jgi:hypothetical protein